MNKFIYLIKETTSIRTLSPIQMQDYLQKWASWIEKLKADESMLLGEPVEITGKQIKGKDRLVFETYHTEEEDMIVGFFVVNALNWDDAIRIAKECPIFEINGDLIIKLVLGVN